MNFVALFRLPASDCWTSQLSSKPNRHDFTKGAAVGPWLLDKLRISDPMAQGLAMGVSSHGIGTGRAVYMGEVAAAFSGLAMGLNGLATAVMLPLLWSWWIG